MMSPRRVSVLSWLLTLLIGVALIGCDQQAPVGSDAPKASDPSPVPTTLSSQVQDSIWTDRLGDLGLPTDLKQGVYSTKNVTVPEQLKKEVQSRAPDDFTIPSSRPNVLEKTNIGEDAKPPKAVRENAADADTVDLNATVDKNNTVPALEDQSTLTVNSDTIYVSAGSYVNPDTFFDWVQMGSWSEASQPITYLDAFGISFVNFVPVAAGGDSGTEYAATSATVDLSDLTWYYQYGDHYFYEDDCGVNGCSIQTVTSAWEFVILF